MKLLLLTVLVSLPTTLCSLTLNSMPGYTLSNSNPSIQLEVFVDPHCGDSAAFWENFESLLDESIDSRTTFTDAVSLRVHMFGLPYHHNSFLACQMLNFFEDKSPNEYLCFLDSMFKNKDYFNGQLTNHSQDYVQGEIIALGKDCLLRTDSKVEKVFENPRLFTKARYDFKYAAKKAIFSYPTVLLNGFEQDVTGMSTEEMLAFFKNVISANKKKSLKEVILQDH